MTSNAKIAGCILAGGQAQRMGREKAFVPLGGRPLIARVIARLSPQVSRLILNANGDAGRFSDYDLPVVVDGIESYAGPLAGILAGLEWAKTNGVDWVATVPVDTPFFPPNLVARLEKAARDKDLACAASGGRTHPVFGLWPASLTGDLRRALTDEGLRKVDQWTGRHRLGIAEWASEPYDPFFNINTPDGLRTAEDILAEFRS